MSMRSRIDLIACCLLASITVVSCGEDAANKEIDAGTVKENVYYNAEIGWEMKIPGGWTVTNRDDVAASTKAGTAAVEETIGQKIDDSKLKYLIGFKLDESNIFQATTEPFEETNPGAWEANHKAVKQLIYATFQSQGIPADTSSRVETIGGLEFKVFEVMIRHAETKRLLLRQHIYSRYINGNDFAAIINYSDRDAGDLMLRFWRASKFTGVENQQLETPILAPDSSLQGVGL